MNESIRRTLDRIGREFGTPCYVYFLDCIHGQIASLKRAFGGRFAISYAIKANPNGALLGQLREAIDMLDASSLGELDRALEAGYKADRLTFSGPGKRPFELERAVELDGVEVVCESEQELEDLDTLADLQSRSVPVLVRINPKHVPRKFGVNLAGKPSPFGIDEEDVPAVLGRLGRGQWPHLDFRGFHIYSGSNALDAETIAENFGIFIDLFVRFAQAQELKPQTLIFGSGFGIPYHNDQAPLALGRLAELINPLIDRIRDCHHLADARCVLELGRFLVGPHGYFLTSVVNEKRSRGTEIRICDGGMNNHLAACGLMGMVIRRNWPMWKVSPGAAGSLHEYMLTGPLCTTIDTLGQQVRLPELHRGDLIAVGSSGAYGLTSSPVRFISHPEPREYLVVGSGEDAAVIDISVPGVGIPGTSDSARVGGF
jgi:diaminopimelate decarboxylase